MSDIDFDDESTDDDLTPAPPTLDKRQVLDKRVAKAKNLSEGDSAAKQLASQIDDQLLATIPVQQAESVSNLELQALSARNLLLDAMNDPESDEESIAAAKKLYMDALQKQLNYHETLARIYETFLEPSFENKIKSDPLLSDEDIASLNSSIMPADSDGMPVPRENLGFKKEIIDAGIGVYTSGDDFFRTPARMARAAEAKKRIAAELNLPDGWEVDLDDDQQALAEIAKIPGRLERQAAYRAYSLSTKPRYLTVRPKDPALKKHGLLLELDNNDSSLLATEEEIALVANTFDEVHGRVDISNLQLINRSSLLTRYNPSGALYIKVGTLMPVRVSETGINLGLFESDESAKKGNAATSPSGVISVNLANLRSFDDPEVRESKKGFYWKDVESAAEKIKGTVSHEIGHQIHYAITDADNYSELRKKASHLQEEGEVNTEYSTRNETEHFAESFSRFVATGEATDRFKNILEQNGLLEQPPIPERIDVPEKYKWPEETLFGVKDYSNKLVAKIHDELGVYVKSLPHSGEYNLLDGESFNNTNTKVTKVEGLVGKQTCWQNVAEAARQGWDGDIYLGFSVNEDGSTSGHAWLMKNGEIFETTDSTREAYYGKKLTGEERTKFLEDYPTPEQPTPDAEEFGPEAPSRNRALDIDLSDIDFDEDDDGQVEPNEIAAAAKAIAASGVGMKLDGRKSNRAIDTPGIDTQGAPIQVGSSGRTGTVPSAQATEIKNNIVALGNQVLDAAYKAAEEKLREQGILPEGVSVKEHAPVARLKEQRIIETSERDDFIDRGKLKELLFAEVDRVSKTITDDELKQYLADRKIPEEIAKTMTLDDNYNPMYKIDDGKGWGGTPSSYWARDEIDSGYVGRERIDTGGGYEYGFGAGLGGPGRNTLRHRIAALKLARGMEPYDPRPLIDLGQKIKMSNDGASWTRKNRFDDKSKEIIRDSIYEELKKVGVEFDSVDMSDYVGKLEPKARRRSGWKALSKKTKTELEAAFQYIPKDVLLAARAYLDEIKKVNPNDPTEGIIGIIESSARAHYSPISWGGYLRGNTADDFLHEFWHFFQDVNLDIAVLENAFLYDRLKDRNGNLPDIEKIDWSYQFTDGDFSHPYTTKQYPRTGGDYFDGRNRNTEVTTTGMQDLFTNPGVYSKAGNIQLTVGKGRNKVLYRNPHMDIATGIWYTNSTMSEKIPGQEIPGNISIRGRANHLGEDTEFRAFNIGLMLSMLDWENK